MNPDPQFMGPTHLTTLWRDGLRAVPLMQARLPQTEIISHFFQDIYEIFERK
jgi:hypothetical protein